MVTISWTRESELWLNEIYNYISQDSPAVATKVVKDIYNKIQVLKEFPEIGYKYRTEKEGNIRVLLYGHYRIAYLIKENNHINILGVFHGSLEMERYL